MIFKYNGYYLTFFNQKIDNDNEIEKFLEKKSNLIKIKKVISNIDLYYITSEQFVKHSKKEIPIFIKKINENELIENINNKKFRYSESNNNARFLFYEDFLTELRYLITGGSNFLVVKNVSDYCYSKFYDLEVDPNSN